MSAEKEIVNFWLNKRGFFTIHNIKASGNKSVGILALRFNQERLKEVMHIEISCSISGNVTDALDVKKTVMHFVKDKFFDRDVESTVHNYVSQFPGPKQETHKILVLGPLPKTRKAEIIASFKEKNIDVWEFDDIACKVIQDMDTQFYKDGIVRTLQLIRYLVLSNPQKLAALVSEEAGILNQNARSEFISELLKNELVQKELSKTDSACLANILKNSSLCKPEVLAELLEKDILNQRTRKPFLASLMEKEKMRKIYKPEQKRKLEKPLDQFFTG